MHSPRTVAALLLILLTTSVVVGACINGAESPTETTAPEVSIPPAALQQVFDQWYDPYSPAGVVLAVQVSDSEPWIESRGSIDPEGTTPMSTEGRFQVGAITVMFVATIAMQLIEEEVLDLEETLDAYVPEIQNSDSITIEQLLRHESGIGRLFDEFDEDGKDFYQYVLDDPTRARTRHEILEIASTREPLFEPGSDFQYSTLNYYLLGQIIELATGSPFTTELNQRILAPLNLEDTFMAGDEEIVGGLTVAYVDIDGDGTDEVFDEESQTAFSTAFWTSGAMVSTAEDLIRFSDALFGGELLEADSLEAMMSVNRTDAPYGIGLFVSNAQVFGATAWSNPGASFYDALLVRIPEQDLTMVVWGNATLESDVPAFRDSSQALPLRDLIRNVVNAVE